MYLKWFLKENEYEKFRDHQHEYSDDGCDGDYIGSVRTGDLCFDIISHGNHLWFDLYVGGIDSGYGYSYRENYKDYPYDFADCCSFMWDKKLESTSFNVFQEEVSKYIVKHLKAHSKYTALVSKKDVLVDLLAKADEKLRLW